MWKRLLVPHDFSPCASRALSTAVELAKVHGSELVLVHASELPANLPPETLVTPADATGPVRIDDYTMRGARQRLELIAEPLRHEGLAVRTHAVAGDVAEQILALANEIGADALVVGTHGRKGLSHLLLGSVAEKVVRLSPVPVLTVSAEAERRASERSSNSGTDATEK